MTARSLPAPRPVAPPTQPTPRAAGGLAVTLLVEVIAPEGRALPALPGWSVTVWPHARLGDLTLEARSCGGARDALLGTLRDAGFTPLGLRDRR